MYVYVVPLQASGGGWGSWGWSSLSKRVDNQDFKFAQNVVKLQFSISGSMGWGKGLCFSGRMKAW